MKDDLWCAVLFLHCPISGLGVPLDRGRSSVIRGITHNGWCCCSFIVQSAGRKSLTGEAVSRGMTYGVVLFLHCPISKLRVLLDRRRNSLSRGMTYGVHSLIVQSAGPESFLTGEEAVSRGMTYGVWCCLFIVKFRKSFLTGEETV